MLSESVTVYNLVMTLLKIVIIPVAVYLVKIDKRTAIMQNDIKNIKENCKFHLAKGGSK